MLVGILFVALFAVGTSLPFSLSQAQSTLSGFESLRTSFLVADILVALLVVFAVPFYSFMRDAFDRKDALLVRSATVLSIAGIVLTSVLYLGETIALAVLAGSYAEGGSTRSTAVVVAQVVIGTGISLLLFGLLLLAAGLGAYGFAMVRGGRFPRWLGFMGIIGAILILPGALPFDAAFIVFIGGFILFLIWVFASSALLLRPAFPKPTS